jgi:hypothetical protein
MQNELDALLTDSELMITQLLQLEVKLGRETMLAMIPCKLRTYWRIKKGQTSELMRRRINDMHRLEFPQ